MNLQIRQAVQSDIPALQSLLLQVEKIHCDGRPDIFKDGGVKFTNEQLAQLLFDPTRPIFCAVNDGQVVGYVFCIITEIKGDPMLRDTKTLHLEDVCVDESCRDGGVGSCLMEYVKTYARENDFTRIDLDVWELNDRAREFYEKHGFGVQKRRMDLVL